MLFLIEKDCSKLKIPSLSKTFKKADIVFSKLRRLEESKNGLCQCVTCDNWHTIAETDAGHYIGREDKGTRYESKNVHPQCKSCNCYHEGRKSRYALYLIQRYGQGILEELEEKARFKKWSVWELEEKIKEWKIKIKSITL